MLTEDIDEMFNTFIEFNITDSFCFLKTEVRSCEINCNYFILLIPYFKKNRNKYICIILLVNIPSNIV